MVVREAVAAPWVLPSFHSEEYLRSFRREEYQDVKFATEAALEVIGALNIARGKEFVIPVPSKGTAAEERIRLNGTTE